MDSLLEGLARGVVSRAADAGLAADTVSCYLHACRVVVRHCRDRRVDRLTREVVDGFAEGQRARVRVGEIGAKRGSMLVRAAWLMWGLQERGVVEWRPRRRRADPVAQGVVDRFAESLRPLLAATSVDEAVGHARRFMERLARTGRVDLSGLTVADVRGFLVDEAASHPGGMGHVVWALRRLFGFFNAAGAANVIESWSRSCPFPSRQAWLSR